MADYFISQTATNGYAVGSDAAAGTSKATAWLTMEKFISTYSAGDTVTINDGTYDHPSSYHSITKSCTIHPENVGMAILTASHQTSRVVNCQPAISGGVYDFDGMVFDGLNTSQMGVNFGDVAGGYTASINNFKAINCNGSSTNGPIAVNATLIVLRGKGLTITGAGTTAGLQARVLTAGSIIDLDGIEVALTGITTPSGSAIWLAATNAGVEARIANVTGSSVHNTGATVSSIVKMENIPGIIEDCHDYVISGTCIAGAPFAIYPSAAVDCITPIVRRNKRIKNLMSGGYLILFGTDSSGAYDNRIINPVSHDNEVSGDAGTMMHGVLFGYCLGGISSHDEFSYVGLPVVMKGQTTAAYVVASKIHHCSTGTSGAIYSKGSVGARFVSALIDMRGYVGYALSSNVDGATVSSDVHFKGNMVIYDADATKVDYVGTGCTATFSWNNYIVPGTVNATTAFVYDGTPAATLAAWGAVHETVYKEDASQEALYRGSNNASWMIGGIEGHLIANRGRL